METVRPSEFAGSFFPDIFKLSMSSMSPEVGRAVIPDTLFDDLDTDLQGSHNAFMLRISPEIYVKVCFKKSNRLGEFLVAV